MKLETDIKDRHSARPPIDSSFEVDFANEIARLESYNKHLYRPNTYLHKWWARRCGTTFRLILKQLVENADGRDFYEPGGLEGRIILDPMMGGGNTLHEAIRLGANVIGADIDPIPVLQARATLSSVPIEDLQSEFDHIFGEIRDETSRFFSTQPPCCDEPTEFMYTLYGRMRLCDCGPSLFVDSLVLRYQSDGSEIRLCETCGDIVQTTGPSEGGLHSCMDNVLTNRIHEKGTSVCPVCQESFRELTDRPYYSRYLPVAVVGECENHGLFFKKPDHSDHNLIKLADDERKELTLEPLLDFVIDPGPKSIDLVRNGIYSYLDLFSSRQLLYLSSATSCISELSSLIKLNLGLLISTSLEFNSMLCGYKGGNRRRPGAIRHVFSHHAYSFPYTALENNPIYLKKISGSLQSLFHSRILRARTWASLPEERLIEQGKVKKKVAIYGEVDAGTEVQDLSELLDGTRKFLLLQGSSASLEVTSNSIDHIVTDPPYFDNVQYGDLAAFFRVWLRRMFPLEANWDYDLGGLAVDPQVNGSDQCEHALTGIFKECNRVLKKNSGRLIFTFHHWNPKGWAALTNALKEARFILANSYVIHSENPASVHIVNLRSLRHDAVLILASSDVESNSSWRLPDQVDTASSESFIGDCANSLGWMLGSELKRDAIRQMWSKLLP